MNQILQTSLVDNSNNKKRRNIYLKTQFYFSIVFIILLGFYIFYSKYKTSKIEKYSSQVLNNYNITRLYSNPNDNNIDNIYSSSEITDNNSFIIGIIKIPKLDISYPIFSTCNDELLKISPCKFYGSLPR